MENFVAEDGGYLRADSLGFCFHPDGNLRKVSRYGFHVEEQRLMATRTHCEVIIW